MPWVQTPKPHKKKKSWKFNFKTIMKWRVLNFFWDLIDCVRYLSARQSNPLIWVWSPMYWTLWIVTHLRAWNKSSFLHLKLIKATYFLTRPVKVGNPGPFYFSTRSFLQTIFCLHACISWWWLDTFSLTWAVVWRKRKEQNKCLY
jgi:hypothetical protein